MKGFRKVAATIVIASICFSSTQVYAQDYGVQESEQQVETGAPDLAVQTAPEETVAIEPNADEIQKKVSAKKLKKEYLGKFKVYAYSSGGTTASGTQTTENRTVAVDPKVIPLGSKIMINGKIYVAEDTGGSIKGKKLDIYIPSYDDCIEWGCKELKVYLIKE